MNARIRLFDLQRQYATIREEVRDALDGVLERAVFLKGPETQAFEAEFAAFCGTRHAVAVGNGTIALEFACRALGIGPGAEVILPANTFIAAAFALSNVGATPVLVDIDPATANIDPAAFERAITPRTKAVMPVHLYGRPAPMDEINAVAGRHGLPVIEDAAQAHGAMYKGRRAGSLGTVAAFSFYPGKNLGAYGDGGAITTDDGTLARRIKLLRDLGQSARYVHEIKGTNGRIDEIQTAVLRVKLRHLDAWNRSRQAAAERYRTAFAGAPVRLLPDDPAAPSVYHLFVIEIERRDDVCAALDRAGIDYAINYRIPIHLQAAYAELAHLRGSLPITERRAAHMVSLPMFAEIRDDEIARVAATVCEALAVGSPR